MKKLILFVIGMLFIVSVSYSQVKYKYGKGVNYASRCSKNKAR